ncbi:hypothetical protein KAI04_04055 [Candidatus Pacearchaeota archaeon]|nr:hypothetical protein [Candidatus Pacearchaeota archaeon]
MKKIKVKPIIKETKYCPFCGCLEVESLSTGEILCKNKYCMKVSVPNIDFNINKPKRKKRVKRINKNENK